MGLALLFAAALSGCVVQRQNPEEFRKVIKDGHGQKDSYVVSRPFDDVYRSIHDKGVPVLIQRFDNTLMSGHHIKHSVAIFRCALAGESGRAQLVIQKENILGSFDPTMPEGDWFWLVADFEAQSPQETRVTTDAWSGLVGGKAGAALDAIKQWAQGNDVPAAPLK